MYKIKDRTSLVAKWLRLHSSNAGGTGSIPGRGTKIPHDMRRGQKKGILYSRDSQCQCFIITINGVQSFKNCESLCCAPEIYIIL